MERKKVGNRIRELREMHNYTREGMAEMVEISPKFLYEIESGKKGFSSDVLCKIARTLTVSCDYIMYGEEHSLRNGEKLSISVGSSMKSSMTSNNTCSK